MRYHGHEGAPIIIRTDSNSSHGPLESETSKNLRGRQHNANNDSSPERGPIPNGGKTHKPRRKRDNSDSGYSTKSSQASGSDYEADTDESQPTMSKEFFYHLPKNMRPKQYRYGPDRTSTQDSDAEPPKHHHVSETVSHVKEEVKEGVERVIHHERKPLTRDQVQRWLETFGRYMGTKSTKTFTLLDLGDLDCLMRLHTIDVAHNVEIAFYTKDDEEREWLTAAMAAADLELTGKEGVGINSWGSKAMPEGDDLLLLAYFAEWSGSRIKYGPYAGLLTDPPDGTKLHGPGGAWGLCKCLERMVQ